MAAPDKCPRGNGGEGQKETHIKTAGAVREPPLFLFVVMLSRGRSIWAVNGLFA